MKLVTYVDALLMPLPMLQCHQCLSLTADSHLQAEGGSITECAAGWWLAANALLVLHGGLVSALRSLSSACAALQVRRHNWKYQSGLLPESRGVAAELCWLQGGSSNVRTVLEQDCLH